MEDTYKKAISKAKELADKILENPSQENIREFVSRKEKLSQINPDRNWINFWWRVNRSKVYKTAAVAASFIISIIVLTQLSKERTDIQPVSQAVNIMPAHGAVSLKLSSGEVVTLDSTTRLESKLSGVTLDDKTGEISYERVSNESAIAGNNLLTNQYNMLSVPKGRSYSLVLSDGTKVWLNAMSSIRYPVKFEEGERVVYISGEAYFDVSEDITRPFIVQTDSYDVKVLGTEFNVSAYSDEKMTAATLVSGSISIPQENGSIIEIKEGEQYRYNKESSNSTIEKVDVELYKSWRNDVLRIDKEQLENIFKIIQRRYEIEFLFTDELAKYEQFTGKLPLNDNLTIVLEQLSKVSNINFQYTEGVVKISYK